MEHLHGDLAGSLHVGHHQVRYCCCILHMPWRECFSCTGDKNFKEFPQIITCTPFYKKTGWVWGLYRSKYRRYSSEMADTYEARRPFDTVSGSGSPTHPYCIEHNLAQLQKFVPRARESAICFACRTGRKLVGICICKHACMCACELPYRWTDR